MERITLTPNDMKTKEQIVEKLRDSFMALQKEYRVSERWVEHFQELFYELAQLLTTPAPPQSGVVDIYEERAHHSHTATSLDTAPTEMQILKWQNKALVEALQYLVDTKERKDTIGKDSIYMARKDLGWRKAKLLLNDIKD